MKRRAVEVAVFVHRAAQLLICHRVHEDYWHVVAGAVEPDETGAQAAKRELQEETGLVADPVDLCLEQTYAMTDAVRHLYSPGTEHVVVGNFHVVAPSDWEPTLNDEHDRYRWTTFGAARELLYWPETRDAFDTLRTRLDEAATRR